MGEHRADGDHITIGNISGSQGIAIGRHASATVIGDNIPTGVKMDPGELRSTLEELYDVLGETELPRDKTRRAQTATGNALEAVTEDQVRSEPVVENVKRVGETLKEANVAVREGSALWQNVQQLSYLLGPLVGGAGVVAGWFGV